MEGWPMGRRRVTLGRDPSAAVRVELLHESGLTRVSRLVFPAVSLIRKEPLGTDGRRRLEHEVEILERLSDVEGVVQLATGVPVCPGSILLIDVGGTALSARATPLGPAELIDLALSLARAGAGMHRRGVVHRNINPTNIVIGGDQAAPILIDFAQATTFPTVHLESVSPAEIVGTVPYLAPEQTGRTGRPVDQRADLYALGATLYEMAVGTPPFGAGDPLRVIHDHLTRVPVAPSVVNLAVPPDLSAIIMHLLEKEPDDRYQSADGLVHDLALVSCGRTVRPGGRDVPTPSLTPSRLAGRDQEIDELRAAFAAAMEGRCRGLLVGGAPGVGKTALVNELRPIVVGSDGWFVAGKLDKRRRDLEYDGVRQALRSLGRLLLAESENDLAEMRERLPQSLGPNAGLIAAFVPELATLLEVAPEPGDPRSAQVRMQRSCIEVLRAVASRKRPLVFVVDDLQEAGRTPLGFLDLIFGDEEPPVEGLLPVGIYRSDKMDATHPLATMLARWQRQPAGPRLLTLSNLTPEGQAALLIDLLHLPPETATELAGLTAPLDGGNPYETIELWNSLRRDGVLALGEGGWRWDRATLRRRLASVDMTALLAARVDVLPSATLGVLKVMACLAGRVEVDLLEVATGLPAVEVKRRLAPALEAGLLLESDGRATSVRFHNDRTQEVVLAGLTPRARRALQLRLARRVAGRSDLFVAAAELYLPVVDAVQSAEERSLVVRLFRRAADEARLASNFLLVERFLSAVITLLDPADIDQLIAVHTDRHAALYSLGRQMDADAVYQVIRQISTDPTRYTDATVVQVRSLTNRGRASEAMRLCLDQLSHLGLAVPDGDHLGVEIERRLDAFYGWVDQTSDSDDLHRPSTADGLRLEVYRLVNAIMPAVYFADHAMMDWLTLIALEAWDRYGLDRVLVGPASHVAFVTVGRRRDYRTGSLVMRRIIAVCESPGYESEIAQARFLSVATAGHWCGPLEENVVMARRAVEGLVQGGDLQNACLAHNTLLFYLLDCAPSLNVFAEKADEALALATRTGNRNAMVLYRTCRWLADVLSDEAAGSAADSAAQAIAEATDPAIVAHVHIIRALAAAVLERPAELDRHTAIVTPLLPAIETHYPAAVARVLRVLAVAGQAREAGAGHRAAMLAELNDLVAWLASRSADAPVNFQHLLHLADAERSWAADDFQEAAYAFDVAQREAAARPRPWHLALILQRAARFYLAHGMERAGRTLLAEARSVYLGWGATAKVGQLDYATPALPEPPGAQLAAQSATPPPTVTTGTIDLLSVIAASQALSSETSLEGLRARVVGILSTMTGATGAQLLLFNQDEHTWSVAVEHGVVSLPDASRRHLLPCSVIRYAERTREPVVIADATTDERFARDPYLTRIGRCSLLAIPIVIRGDLRAMLMLENRMIRGAFSAERLEGIMLISAQLAVSLENALVYASLEKKVAERTQQLAAANRRLEQLSIIDPLTGLANRRHFDKVLDAEWRRAAQLGEPIALAMIDVDRFKLYNDTFGHVAGDRCLARVATCLADNTRATDLVARYGGEEFVVIMPGADIDSAARGVHRLRSAVAELAEGRPTADLNVTVSIGLATAIPTPNDNMTSLVERADFALYQAKSRGRNRVEVAPSLSAPR